MLAIAEKKKKENVAEYILYMWQMEDLLRGLNFNLDQLEEEVFSEVSDEQAKSTNMLWFKKLARDMKDQAVDVSGHHQDTVELIQQLVFLQNKLLAIGQNKAFIEAFKEAKPVMEEFRKRSDQIPTNDVETALTALYGMLALRISGKEISPETRAGIQSMSKYLAHLSHAFKSEESI